VKKKIIAINIIMDHDQINSVNVYSVDEERLRFRVIVGIDGTLYAAQPLVGGNYDINIPIPTSFTNSHEYSQCLIRCELFSAHGAPLANTCTWSDGAPAPGGRVKTACIELQLGVGSSQTTDSFINNANAVNAGETESGGFRQVLPMQIVNVGNPVSPAVAVDGFAFMSVPAARTTSPILCSNPFGSNLRIRLVDPIQRTPLYLTDAAVGPGATYADVGQYVFQFHVELVK
jgi:hypothetical protein